MEKRLILALALSLLFLSIYSKYISLRYPVAGKEVTNTEQFTEDSAERKTTNLGENFYNNALTKKTQSFSKLNLTQSLDKSKLIKIESNEIELYFNPKGAYIEECILKKYNFSLPQKKIGLIFEFATENFNHKFITNGISFSYDDKVTGLSITKEFRFTSDFSVSLDVLISNPPADNKVFSLNIGTIEEALLKENSLEQRYYELSFLTKATLLRRNYSYWSKKKLEIINQNISELLWIGIRSRYLCSIIKPKFQIASIDNLTIDGAISYIINFHNQSLLKASNSKDNLFSFLIYLGPQKTDLIAKVDKEMPQIVNFGFLDSFCHIVVDVLNLLFKITKNWGITIILFSLFIFVLTSPLSLKSFSSIKKMQEIQPAVEELRQKFKDNPQKLNREIMELYKSKKINPLSGCFPLLLQMPIFFSLYQVLIRLIDLKNANFIWIKDLSQPDRLFILPFKLPIIGNDLNLLPILMMLVMAIQQKMSLTKTQSELTKQSTIMNWFMVVFFGIIFYSMPSGLVLYWFMNSLLMLTFQIKLYPRIT